MKSAPRAALRRGLGCAIAPIALLAACTDEKPQSAPHAPPVDPFYLEIASELEPCADEADARPVLAVAGVPICRGAIERLAALFAAVSPPDRARQPLLEDALVGSLLPRALVLSILPREELREIAGIFGRCRDEMGHYDLARLARELAPHAAEPPGEGRIEEVTPSAILRQAPVRAEAVARLVKAGQQVGPFYSKYGVFVIELASPLEAPPALETTRRVRVVGLAWPIAADGEHGVTASRVLEAQRRAIQRREIAILDEAYAQAVPEWYP